ncbi:divalent-cation tolerance protein CutA [Vibrio sp. AK197]
MSSGYCIVLTTTNDQRNRQLIIDSVLQEKLAACIQAMPIESNYLWQGETCCDHETLLIFKTTDRCYQELADLIAQLHDYETPQIVKIPFSDGANPYLQWLSASTKA